MPDENMPAGPAKTESTGSTPASESPPEQRFDELIANARQAIKPIIEREAANEIVTDELLNFRMKASKVLE